MALVSKILESTLTAGSTTVTFTDSDIPNSLIRVFSSNSDIIPESRILSGNTLTVTYAPQSNNIDVAVEIVKQGLDIVDNVLSEDTDKALSAKQGYLLSAAIGDVSDGLSALSETVNNLDIPDNITDLDDVTVTNIQSGQVLAWDGTKFVNVNQSGGINYSLDEHVIGTWIDGKTLYEKTIDCGALPNTNTKAIAFDNSNFKIIDFKGYAHNSVSGNTLCLPYPNSISIQNQIGIYISTSSINIQTGGNLSAYDVSYITVRYTKNTD